MDPQSIMMDGISPSVNWRQNAYVLDFNLDDGFCMSLAFDFAHEYLLQPQKDIIDLFMERFLNNNPNQTIATLAYRHKQYENYYPNGASFADILNYFITTLYGGNQGLKVFANKVADTLTPNSVHNIVTYINSTASQLRVFIFTIKLQKHGNHAVTLINDAPDGYYFFDPSIGLYKISGSAKLESFLLDYIKKLRVKAIHIGVIAK